jgi:CheY-like chemotaxis protein
MRARRANSRRCLVLIVDDIADNRELYGQGLIERGYDVISASEGGEAVDAVRLHQPEIVVMDLGMPVLDGFEATKRIRLLADIDQPYVVALSAFTDRTSRAHALEAGCDEFLSKPLLPDELANRLDAIISSGRTRAR